MEMEWNGTGQLIREVEARRRGRGGLQARSRTRSTPGWVGGFHDGFSGLRNVCLLFLFIGCGNCVLGNTAVKGHDGTPSPLSLFLSSSEDRPMEAYINTYMRQGGAELDLWTTSCQHT